MARRGRKWRRFRRAVGGAAIPWLAPSTVSLLSRSWELETLGREHSDVVIGGPGGLVAMWHGRMILGVAAYGDQDIHVLVSPSKDGDLAEKLLTRFGYHVIRGSTNKRSAGALREMVKRLSRGAQIVITPDGPRGPRHSVNQGTAWLSKITGFPILPAGLVCDRAWRLKSWDRFTIPKPRARVVIAFGEPIHVSSDASTEELDQATARMRERIIAAEVRGCEHLAVEPDW